MFKAEIFVSSDSQTFENTITRDTEELLQDQIEHIIATLYHMGYLHEEEPDEYKSVMTWIPAKEIKSVRFQITEIDE